MLSCYTVLDFTDERGEIGPMLLGDMGAQVIRVEPPEGSPARGTLPRDATGSLQFQAYNRNKASIVLDPDDASDQQVLAELVARADFLFESYPTGLLTRFGYDRDRVRACNGRVVHVRLSPFGSDAPYADYVANDLVIAAMGGPVALQGSPDRAPLRLSVPQVWRHAGAEAAAGAMVAHARMLRTGQGQFVDVSAQAAMTWTMLNAMDAFAIQGFDFERVGSRVNNGIVLIDVVHPTTDGYILALPVGKTIAGCLEWMIEDGVADASYRDIDWQNIDLRVPDGDELPINLAEATALCRQFFARHTKDELFRHGLAQGVSLAPINTLPELLAQDHLAARDYWLPLEQGAGGSVKTPGLWARSVQAPLSVRRPAPALGQDTAALRAWVAEPAATAELPQPDGETLPFAGLRVADFSWVGVGPISAKCLADHGADVIRVESENRPDVLRAGGPFRGSGPGWNKSQFFGDFNTSKRSFALDLKTPEGIELAKALIAEADVMIESFAPGAIERMGLNYEAVKAINPSLIMVSTCLMGQTGPAASLAGYGYHAAAIAGFCEVTGWPDREPNGPWIAYTDTVAPRFISALLAAALDRRRRTGEGAYFDVAQLETALHFLAPELLDMQVNGVVATRRGNRSAHFAPQGCYPCAGEDNWVAIAVESEAEWQALCSETGLAREGLDSHAARLAVHDELDAYLADWTRPQTAQAVMHRLQARRVPAGVVQRSSDLLADPQYGAREFYRFYEHPEMGHIPYAGHQYRIDGYRNGPRGPAPLLGQHSFDVLSEVLGLDDEAIARAFANGIIN